MAEALKEMSTPKEKPRARLTFIEKDSVTPDNLSDVGLGRKVKVTITGEVSAVENYEYRDEIGLSLIIGECEITLDDDEGMTIDKAVNKAERRA